MIGTGKEQALISDLTVTPAVESNSLTLTKSFSKNRPMYILRVSCYSYLCHLFVALGHQDFTGDLSIFYSSDLMPTFTPRKQISSNVYKKSQKLPSVRFGEEKVSGSGWVRSCNDIRSPLQISLQGDQRQGRSLACLLHGGFPEAVGGSLWEIRG